MPTVAFINNGFPRGGVARITIDIARYCKSHAPEFRIAVLGKHIDPESISREIRELVTIIPGADYLKNAIEARADIIVACSSRFSDAPRARKSGIKVIFANHGESFQERYGIMSRRRKNKLLWNLLYRRKYSDGSLALSMAKERVIWNYANSDAYVTLCEGYRKETISVLPPEYAPYHVFAINNPEYPVSNPNLEKEKMILYSGRLSYFDKAPYRLLRIWEKAQDLLPEYRLEIVGDGPDKDDMVSLASKLRLSRCHFRGWHDNVSDWYSKADILCLVSKTEGWPLCVSEALANGVIPVAYNCSAGVEALLDGTGFTVEPKDQDEFVSTLVKVANMDESEKLRLRKKGVEKALGLDPEIICGEWVSLFRQVLSL